MAPSPIRVSRIVEWGTDPAPGADPRRAVQAREWGDDRVLADLDRGIDDRRGGGDDGHAGEHVAIVDPALCDLGSTVASATRSLIPERLSGVPKLIGQDGPLMGHG